MPAPSVPFTSVPSGDLDPDSPITTELMTALYENGLNVNEQVSFGYTAAQAHTHDGVNSAPVVLTATAMKRAKAVFNETSANPDFDVTTGFTPRIAWATFLLVNYPDGGISADSWSWGFATGLTTDNDAHSIGFGDFSAGDYATDGNQIGAAAVDGTTGIASSFLKGLSVTQFDTTRVRVEPSSALSVSRDWGGIMVVIGTANA